MKFLSFLFISSFLSFSLFCAENPFTKGSGSKFSLTMKNSPSAELSIYVTESSNENIAVEYFFLAQNTFIQTKMWQQFHLKMSNNKINIHKGFVKIPENPAPEIMDPQMFQQKDGVQLNDFLFSKKEGMNKFKVSEGKVEVPAGSVQAIHYRKKNGDQTVDFWISDQAKPIGLVKLISTNPKKDTQNYKVELLTLVTNVKASIDPSKAVKMSEKTKQRLSNPLKNR